MECQKCGACCRHAGEVSLTGEEAARIMPSYLIDERGGAYGPAMGRDADGTCLAFSYVTNLCRLHKNGMKPEACRAFEPGQVECLRARVKQGEVLVW